jgi:hypothetical protein
VQLSKLVQDFQNPGLTAEMKKRFSVDAEGRSSLALDDAAAYGDLLSPTRARGGGGSRCVCICKCVGSALQMPVLPACLLPLLLLLKP